MAVKTNRQNNISIAVVCEVFNISKSTYYYQPKLSDDNALIANYLTRLTQTHKRWGFKLCYFYLRNVKGFKWNHKRIYRIYCELELNLRIKPKSRIKRDKPEALSVPKRINQMWSMDFMSDSLTNGRSIRTFNVLDDYNREGLNLDVDLSMPARRVIQSLERLIQWRGIPKAIRCDNGPEYISHALRDWAQARGIDIAYIQPGKPTQNAYIERFNKTVRQECLELHLFDTIEQAQNMTTQWLWTYNNERPHFALGGIPPRQKLVA